LRSQYPFPLGVEAIASHPKAALSVLGDCGEKLQAPGVALPEP
jgi:hypothetical protein